MSNQRFTCHSCAVCCRDWHVELTAEEAGRIPALTWPDGDRLQKDAVIQRRGGRTYLAHRPDGACVFLNPDNNRCRIHERYGPKAKPLGCQLFPFHIAPTFSGEASAILRHDCPSVRRDDGELIDRYQGDLAQLARALNIQGGFDDLTRCVLEREQIQAAVEFALTLMNGFADDDRRALFLHLYAEWLSEQSVDSLDRGSLGAGYALIREVVDQTAEAIAQGKAVHGAAPSVSGAHRMAFRAFLALHLRRDEDVLHGRATRLGRMTATALMAAGRGNLRRLGAAHADAALAPARLFRGGHRFENAAACALLWRMIRGRLESFQFMGAGNGGRSFIDGLRSLTLVYPLTVAVAKVAAAAQRRDAINAEDIDIAVAMIDHGYGRSPALNHALARRVEAMLTPHAVYPALALTM